MAKDRFLIAPFETGLQTDIKPWLIPDEAFASLQNVYVYKGTLRKRPGSQLQNQTQPLAVQQLFSRLAINIGTTQADGSLVNVNIPGNVAKVGQIFSVGSTIITPTALGTPVAGANILLTAPINGLVLNLNIAGPNNIQWAATAGIELMTVYYYPAEPVMGIYQVPATPVANNPNQLDDLVTAYDTQFPYQYLAGHWEYLGAVPPSTFGVPQPVGAAMWTSSNSQFMWATNWWKLNPNTKAVYASNNKPLQSVAAANRNVAYDGIKVFNTALATWANFFPLVANGPAALGIILSGCLSMQVFKNCFFVFNTIERTTPGGGGAGVDSFFPNRLRYSAPGADPGGNNLAGAGNFDALSNSGAGVIDIPTDEAIVSVSSVKDRLIVFCEQSTYEVVYTGVASRLFLVQRINSELGVESTYSPTLFDRAVLGVGNFGVLACNGANVERIDEKIVNEVFEVRNSDNGLIRTHGVRDYFTECVYWTFCTPITIDSYPNKILLYNYRNGSFALFDDSITAFGYDNNATDLQWQNINIAWQDMDRPWDDPSLQSQFTPVLAGNQQGILFKFFRDFPELAQGQYITNMVFANAQITITSINHNNAPGSYIQISNAQGANLTGVNGTIFEVGQFIDVNTFTVGYVPIGGETYTGGGTTQRVSRIEAITKQFNLYQKDGFNCRFEKVQFLVDQETSAGAEIGVQYRCNTNQTGLGNLPASPQTNASIQLNAYQLYPYETGSDQFWRTLYTNVQGTYVQLVIGYYQDQMLNPNSAFSDFQLNAMMIHASPTSSRFQ
jgi:hypothetical protein